MYFERYGKTCFQYVKHSLYYVLNLQFISCCVYAHKTFNIKDPICNSSVVSSAENSGHLRPTYGRV